MTQVLLKVRFTTIERLTGYQSCSSPKKVQVYYYYIYIPEGVNHTHFNWHVIL